MADIFSGLALFTDCEDKHSIQSNEMAAVISETKSTSSSRIPSPFKRVFIQSLSTIKQESTPAEVKTDYWLSVHCGKHFKYDENDETVNTCKCTTLTQCQNVPTNTTSTHGVKFFDAFYKAYNTHSGVILSPDDFKLHFNLRFSDYVNSKDTAELIRHKFVTHEGKKILKVQFGQTIDWELFFQLIEKQIYANSNEKVAADLVGRFSTTGFVERVLSAASTMSICKKYFSYEMSTFCGISHVDYMGNLDDWTKLLTQVKALRSYVNEEKMTPSMTEWQSFVDGFVLILDKLISQFTSGIADCAWWNKIISLRSTKGSGGTTYVSGWILGLLGCQTTEVGLYKMGAHVPSSFQFPVTHDDGGVLREYLVMGGFSGVTKNETLNSFRPQQSLSVIYPKPEMVVIVPAHPNLLDADNSD